MAVTTPTPTPLPPRSQGPFIMLVLMGGLFVVLVTILVKNYQSYWSEAEPLGSRPAAPSRPATRPAPTDAIDSQLPADVGFAQRNVEYGGNLAPIVAKEGAPLGLDEATYRVALDLSRADASKFAEKTTQLPQLADLLAHPEAYFGMAFTFRIVPAEVWDYANDVPERVTSWRIYGLLQRDRDEFLVLETIDAPPKRDWTLKRDVIEVDALFLRTATYEARKDQSLKRVPYLLAKSYRKVVKDDARGAPPPGITRILDSPYGWMVGVAILVFVLLTVWTLRRHARQTEKREREHFYTMLRARKHNPPKPPV